MSDNKSRNREIRSIYAYFARFCWTDSRLSMFFLVFNNFFESAGDPSRDDSGKLKGMFGNRIKLDSV
jgi:hypothetical protein